MQTSPRSSPRERGSRSPAYPRQDSTGTLKATISLIPGKNPSVTQTGTFYLMRDTPEPADITGSNNLLARYGLEHSYNKFFGKKVKEELSAFLPHLPGNIDTPGHQDNSSLRSLIEKAPILGKELIPLSGPALSGFRLHPGPLPEQYQMMAQMPHKKKKHKKRSREVEKTNAVPVAQAPDNAGDNEAKKPKKGKKEEEPKEKRKKKKEKKKKKQKHSPDQPTPHTNIDTGS
ncbi:mediator of RNA polymerase II transcription subunit 19-like isoform X1 [Pomacea canaliculata]|uniref:mediator of RNA polymerase II transcription subunit 19-like isoform X1 n=1 Tax=Pomacea canaliculata TaxID=400727 RepID=UPI000D73CED4|nr:mediator of RNA polymerase II transcription subunit 19-like isoform X1 [Pomacea canaliculata]